MKKILTIVAALMLAFSVSGQTNQPPVTNAPPLGEPFSKVISFLSASATNWMVVPYGIYCEDVNKAGGGLAVLYSLSEFAATGLRLDYIDQELWMPSVDIQLQLPLRLANKVEVVPFVLSGIATPIAGRGDENGQVTGIFGSGLAVRITKKLDVVYDAEAWTGFSGIQHRFGVLWKF